ncbi:MAG: ornithine cyclodeaminase family protein [Halobacteriales archaeon]
METLIFDTEAVESAARTEAVVSAVEDAFGAYERGNAIMPAKSYIDLPQYDGDFRAMPAYLDVRGSDASASQRDVSEESRTGEGWDAAGLKWVNSHPDNPDSHDLPTVMGTMIYSDPETAFPLAIMDGTVLTKRRTGAAAAVATDHLAIEDARSLGIVGAGAQAYAQTEAIAAVRPIETVVVADRNADRQAAFVEAFDDHFDVRPGSIAEAAGRDVLSTVTPVAEPIVPRDAVSEHTHVNAMGADAVGKRELEEAILLDATLVIDDYEQCTHSGEINVPWSRGVLSDADLHAELGEVVTGRKRGRTDADGISVFDSTGLAIQDVATAHVVYEAATDTGNGEAVSLLSDSI